MANRPDVRRIALSLHETSEAEDGFAFSVRHGSKQKGIAWVWMERVEPKKPRVPQPAVSAIRVANRSEKEMLLASDDEKFFTEPHYNGFPAVLVRLAAVEVDELRGTDHRCLAFAGATRGGEGVRRRERRGGPDDPDPA